jgi:hypothetical protein
LERRKTIPLGEIANTGSLRLGDRWTDRHAVHRLKKNDVCAIIDLRVHQADLDFDFGLAVKAVDSRYRTAWTERLRCPCSKWRALCAA